MSSWDKPSSGNQEGTRLPRPSTFPYDPYASVGDSPAAANLQKTDRTDTGTDARSDRGPGFTDRGRDTEKVTRLESTVKRFEGLFQRQGDLINSQQKQIDRLSSDLDRQDKTIEKLEAKNEKLEATNDRQAKELEAKDATIGQLKEQISELEGGSSIDNAPNVVSDEAMTEARPAADKPWYRKAAEKLPDKDALAFGTTGAAFAEILATNAHHLSGPMQAAIAGGTAFGTAGYTLLKKQIDKHVNKDKGGNNAD